LIAKERIWTKERERERDIFLFCFFFEDLRKRTKRPTLCWIMFSFFLFAVRYF